jgi:hypothetical protein
MICIAANVIILKFAGSENHQKYEVFYIKQNRIPGITYYGATMYDLDNDGKEEIIISMQNYPNTGHRLLSAIYKPDSTTNVIREVPETPEKYFLYQNYPNPFNPSTIIKFSVSDHSFVSIKVYNILGKEIKLLLEENLPAGEHNAQWNGKDNEGIPLPTGIYFIQMRAIPKGRQAGEYQQTIKTLLLK